MPEAENELPVPRGLAKKDQERLTELERTVKALVVAIKATEEEEAISVMPVGTYYGIKFDE
jgi:hypothetical protein